MSDDGSDDRVFAELFAEVRLALTPPVGLKEALRARVVERGRQDETGQPVTARLRFWGPATWARWVPAAAAAAVCVAVMTVLLLNGSMTSSVYAQAVLALQEAKSIHGQGFRVRDGVERLEAEVWYEANVGVRERMLQADGTVFERLDNGQFQWTYRSADKTVVKTVSTDPVGRAIVKCLRFDERFGQDRLERLPTEDRAVDGADCLAYEIRGGQGNTRMVVWIDRQKRPRRLDELHEDNGRWTADEITRIAYDQAPARSLFEADFGPGVQVVDLTTAKSPLFLEQESLLHKEVLGLEISVVQLQMLDNGAILLTWSIGPTDDTRRRFVSTVDGQTRWPLLGDAQVSTQWKRLDDGRGRYLGTMDIAKFTDGGVETVWTLLVPRGAWPRPLETMGIEFRVYSRNELQEQFTKAGQPWFLDKYNLGELPLPKNTTTMDAACLEVYSQIGWATNHFQAAGRFSASQPQLMGRWLSRQEAIEKGHLTSQDPEGLSVQLWHTPAETTPGQFVEDVRAGYERLLK